MEFPTSNSRISPLKLWGIAIVKCSYHQAAWRLLTSKIYDYAQLASLICADRRISPRLILLEAFLGAELWTLRASWHGCWPIQEKPSWRIGYFVVDERKSSQKGSSTRNSIRWTNLSAVVTFYKWYFSFLANFLVSFAVHLLWESGRRESAGFLSRNCLPYGPHCPGSKELACLDLQPLRGLPIARCSVCSLFGPKQKKKER